MNNYSTLTKITYTMWATGRSVSGVHVQTGPSFPVFHDNGGKPRIGHLLHFPILDKSPVHYISDEWSSYLCPFPSSGKMLLCHSVSNLYGYPQVSTLLLAQYVLLSAESHDSVALTTAPKFLFDNHKTLINTVTAILLHEEPENPVTSPMSFAQ